MEFVNYITETEGLESKQPQRQQQRLEAGPIQPAGMPKILSSLWRLRSPAPRSSSEADRPDVPGAILQSAYIGRINGTCRGPVLGIAWPDSDSERALAAGSSMRGRTALWGPTRPYRALGRGQARAAAERAGLRAYLSIYLSIYMYRERERE